MMAGYALSCLMVTLGFFLYVALLSLVLCYDTKDFLVPRRCSKFLRAELQNARLSHSITGFQRCQEHLMQVPALTAVSVRIEKHISSEIFNALI